MGRTWRRLLGLGLLASLLAGCATSSLFQPYPQRAQAYKQAIAAADFQKPLKDLDSRRSDKDRLLFLLERGRLAQLAGDTDASLGDYTQAIDAFRSIEDRARISASYTLAQGTALISNDNAIPYQGSPYERIFLHQFQALNYVAKGDLPGALVEVRRANLEQEQALREHEKLVEKAATDAEQGKVKVDPANYQSYFAPLDDSANRVKNAFQNAYTFYTSALLYEAAGEYNDAYIDYKRALEIFPDNPYVQQDVFRLAQRLGRRDDVKAMAGRIKEAPATAPGEGTVVVLYEEGFAPSKQAITIPFPWPYAWYMVSLPTYGQPWQGSSPLAIQVPGRSLQSAPIVEVQALASRALKDDLLPILVRQTLRAYTKHEMAKQTQQQQGDLLGFLVSAYNFISEQADLRSWQTLPGNAQIARLNLPAGPQAFTLNTAQTQAAVTVPVSRGRMTLLRVTYAGGRLYTASYPL